MTTTELLQTIRAMVLDCKGATWMLFDEAEAFLADRKRGTFGESASEYKSKLNVSVAPLEQAAQDDPTLSPLVQNIKKELHAIIENAEDRLLRIIKEIKQQ